LALEKNTMLAWLQKMILQSWGGRLIVLSLAFTSGYLVKWGISADLVANWADLTKQILEQLLPIALAYVLSAIRHKVALDTVPPKILGKIKECENASQSIPKRSV
jgi:hypothetical protein